MAATLIIFLYIIGVEKSWRAAAALMMLLYFSGMERFRRAEVTLMIFVRFFRCGEVQERGINTNDFVRMGMGSRQHVE